MFGLEQTLSAALVRSKSKRALTSSITWEMVAVGLWVLAAKDVLGWRVKTIGPSTLPKVCCACPPDASKFVLVDISLCPI